MAMRHEGLSVIYGTGATRHKPLGHLDSASERPRGFLRSNAGGMGRRRDGKEDVLIHVRPTNEIGGQKTWRQGRGTGQGSKMHPTGAPMGAGRDGAGDVRGRRIERLCHGVAGTRRIAKCTIIIRPRHVQREQRHNDEPRDHSNHFGTLRLCLEPIIDAYQIPTHFRRLLWVDSTPRQTSSPATDLARVERQVDDRYCDEGGYPVSRRARTSSLSS